MDQCVLKILFEHATIHEKRKSFYRVVKMLGISEQKTAVHRQEQSLS